jgi:uncharacterized protein YjeT (DUF2065 family)
VGRLYQIKVTMNSTIWLALALVLVLEGLGPLLYPRAWRKMVASLSQFRIIYCGALAADLWLPGL